MSRRQTGMGISAGDGDSSSASMDIKLNADKDISDLVFALSPIGKQVE